MSYVSDVNECMESPPRCKNGATCQNSEGDYDCTCVTGWVGKDCDVGQLSDVNFE